MVHTMVNVLGTPVRAEGERKERAWESGREGMRERLQRKNQREGGRENRWVTRAAPYGCIGCSLCSTED